MKKLGLAVIVALLIAAVVVAGCGKKESKAPTGAQAVLSKSQQASKNIKSFKAGGTADLQTPQSEVKANKITYDSQTKVITTSDVETALKATDDKGKTTQVYIVGGYMYSFDTAQGWTKQKVENAEQLTGSNLFSPNQISEMGKYAKNLKQLPDEGNNYVISFDVGTKFFENALAGAGQSSSPSNAQASKDAMDLIKGMLGGLSMNVVMKVDKTTYYPSSAKINVGLKGAPMIGDLTALTDMAFTGYNEPVTITLPPEAQSAKEVAPSATGLPNIPGLGL